MRSFSLGIALAGVLLAAGTFAQDEADFRAKREASLKAPDGWLSVAGLFWLHDGTMNVGSDPQSDIVLPSNAPRHGGTMRMQSGVVTFEAAKGVNASVDGKSVTKVTMKPDTDPHPTMLQLGSLKLTIIKRMDRTGVRMRDPEAATRKNFTGCKWFPASQAWKITAKWVAYPTPHKIKITNILGMTDDEPAPGYAEFTVQGKTVRLEPVADDTGELEIMFKDTTSGNTTYQLGRFLDPDKPKDGKIVLDFNQAYNPPCQFISYATCPTPPKQNVLPVAITAGEMKYANHPSVQSAGGSAR